jgi:hypothetical protein
MEIRFKIAAPEEHSALCLVFVLELAGGSRTTMRWHYPIVFAFLVLAGSAEAAPLELGAVNEAQLQLPLRAKERANPTLIKAQVLLDRAHFSPGEIDGKFGENFKKALIAFAATQGLNSKGELTDEIWQKLTATSSDPVLTKYTLSTDDVGGHLFTAFLPNWRK